MSVFFEISGVPVHCNLLWPSREAAVAAPRGDIRLGFCEACGMVYNVSFDPTLMEYSQQYENSLHFSPTFQRYARELATRLIEGYGLRGKQIIEIGCGRGDFLSMLCEGGRNRGLGFDPGHDGAAEGGTPPGSVTFASDSYSSAYATHKADLICCRHTLEHIADPHRFLLEIRRAIGPRTGTAVFFEVPNVLFTLRDLGVWDIIYEHCSYFSAPSLARLFEETGFTVREVYAAFGDQFLCLEGHAAAATTNRGGARSAEEIELLSTLVCAFGDDYRSQVEAWGRRLSQWLEAHRRIVLWGAGSKGATFLNVVEASGQIEYVVDVNPRKEGMYVAGSGQRIVPPDFLREYRPDVVLIVNPIYREEIGVMLGGMGVEAEVVTVQDEGRQRPIHGAHGKTT